MISEFVPTSGAGTSRSGPIRFRSISASTYSSVSRFSSALESVAGSTAIPPFAPPMGIPISQSLMLISIACAFIMSIETSGWYRFPPLCGLSVCGDLCHTRHALYISSVPSSFVSKRSPSHLDLKARSTLICQSGRFNILPASLILTRILSKCSVVFSLAVTTFHSPQTKLSLRYSSSHYRSTSQKVAPHGSQKPNDCQPSSRVPLHGPYTFWLFQQIAQKALRRRSLPTPHPFRAKGN